MKLTFHIPGALRPFTGGRADVPLETGSRTVGDALGAVFALHPGLRDRVMTEAHQLRPHVNLFLGDENIRFLEGLETPLSDGAVITILPAVSGG